MNASRLSDDFSPRVGGAESYNNSFYEFSITTFMRVEIHFTHYILL